MADIEDFRRLFKDDFDRCMREYVLQSDSTLDYGDAKNEKDPTDPRTLNVAFDFSPENIITMRAAKEGEDHTYEISYLPWRRDFVTHMTLDDTGPGLFSTSQLNGCRFTIKYSDDTRKKAMVLHGAGNLDRQVRESSEKAELDKLNFTGITRRYSITRGAIGLKGFIKDDSRLVYDGDKAWIVGVRGSDKAWKFYAQEMNWQMTKVGVKPLT